MNQILTWESSSIFFEEPQFITQLHHGLTNNCFLIFVLRFEICESNFSCILIGLQHSTQCCYLLPLCWQKWLQLYNLFLKFWKFRLFRVIVDNCNVTKKMCLCTNMKYPVKDFYLAVIKSILYIKTFNLYSTPSDMFPRTPFILDSSIVFSTAVRRYLIWSRIVSTCFAITVASFRISRSFNETSVFRRLRSNSNLDIA